MEVGSMDDEHEAETWTIQRSADLYQVRGWGHPYFTINQAGRVEVVPDPERPSLTIDLYELVNDLDARGLELPLLLRFSDVLRDRIKRINECFAKAIDEYQYKGAYRGVFPVKVNQQKHFIDEVVEFGAPWRLGLEAGSKPELLIALSAEQEAGGLVICNGYKDQAYIETALLAQRFDKTVIVVLERIEELDFTFRAFAKTGIRPTIGVRAKLGSRGMGRWADSTGERAKFGLTASEIVEVVDRLQEKGMLDCLQLLHFHAGSQISSIIPIKQAVREAANIFAELAKMGASMRYLDVGGGLAVDYDGSKTDFHASKNYNIQEYAYDVVAAVKESCEKYDLTPPTIVTESGRAIAAHQSVLVYEVVGRNEVRFGKPQDPGPKAHKILQQLFETYQGIAPKNLQEAFHDASQAKEEAESLFKFGYLGLRERAQAERLFWSCCEKISDYAKTMKRVPEEVQQLDQVMAAMYYGNFSVFQSIPDSWAIDQLFPIMPIHRLNEEPTIKATIADLTCDSDGKVDHFIDVEDVKRVLPVHRWREGERYFMGIFLNGAYQEILGDLHNLFGDTNAVHVQLDGEGGYEVSHFVKGDTITQVLEYVEYEPGAMVERVRRQAERARRQGLITFDQVKMLMKHYEESLGSYTYLTQDE
ncbi:Biosynthetic arginine decarboxylase [Sandaracinus amylolyticus]|uniref:Biosynthetic arginine decarboxylase n=2 Tax=Sandaracinus amylolyticus TaxID=927083 RepID=A0A0F6VZV6_9BACT|nr:Biosynthetic arginine decarboxylase [Sandaracinus amylolyticus]